MTTPAADDGVGCRSAFLTGLLMVVVAVACGAVGLWLVLSRAEGLWLFYAAAPASALFGVVGGGLPIAWPLDIGIWLMLGVGVVSWAGRFRQRTWHVGLAVALVAVAYGLTLSQLVEVEQLS
ncbi:hypothetical protein BH23ACT5_BH23ACT5_13660 [soil metagenome]